MICQTLGDSLRTFVLVNGSRRQGIVAYNSPAVEHHVRLRRVCLLICPGESLQPTAKSGVAAVELTELVLATEFVDLKFRRWEIPHPRRFATWGSVNNRRSRGFYRGGRSSAAMNAFHCRSSRTNRGRPDPARPSRERCAG